MPESMTEVFRAARQADCDERVFMLSAVGIASTVDFDGANFLLQVDTAEASRARGHLAQYEVERLARPIESAISLPNHPNAWLGCVLYALVLVGVSQINANGLWRLDAASLGELDAARVQTGQWWRAWTALTLHVDGEHLAANLAGGIWFGYLAGRQLGAGTAWLLTVIGGGTANLLEGLLGPATHRAIGASTAVFTALGLLAGHEWRRPGRTAMRWAKRWAPMVGGILLLGWIGTGGGERTDVLAHVIGFLVGSAIGAIAAQPPIARWLNRVPQWLAGLIALGIIGFAWSSALGH
jgi:membrane associated rhomboid family serine protease